MSETICAICGKKTISRLDGLIVYHKYDEIYRKYDQEKKFYVCWKCALADIKNIEQGEFVDQALKVLELLKKFDIESLIKVIENSALKQDESVSRVLKDVEEKN